MTGRRTPWRQRIPMPIQSRPWPQPSQYFTPSAPGASQVTSRARYTAECTNERARSRSKVMSPQGRGRGARRAVALTPASPPSAAAAPPPPPGRAPRRRRAHPPQPPAPLRGPGLDARGPPGVVVVLVVGHHLGPRREPGEAHEQDEPVRGLGERLDGEAVGD